MKSSHIIPHRVASIVTSLLTLFWNSQKDRSVRFLASLVSHVVFYLRRRLASGEGIVTLDVMLCVCLPSCLYHVSTARCISLGGEGDALYPVLSGCLMLPGWVANNIVCSYLLIIEVHFQITLYSRLLCGYMRVLVT